MSSLDTVFGLSEASLKLAEQRSQLLASNLANRDTPLYQARDVDFKRILSRLQSNDVRSVESVALKATTARHFDAPVLDLDADDAVGYRLNAQPSRDGNTVDSNQEVVQFTENALRYQATLSLIKRQYHQLLTAVKGE